MWCNCVGFVRWLAPLLFFEAVANFSLFCQLYVLEECCFANTDNGSGIAEGGDF